MARVITGQALRQHPEATEKGVIAAVCRISLSLSWSSGDVHVVGWLPHGAIPLDAIFYPGAGFAATGIAKFGVSASQEMFFASDSYAESGTTIYRAIKQLGSRQQISLSDDAMPRKEAIVMVATAGVSIAAVGDLIIYYRMPGQSLNP